MQFFNVGDIVRIKCGSFANFTGVVDRIDISKAVLVVDVEIFGRRTAVEVTFSEAEKVGFPQPPSSDITNLN
ncbi:MAG TPA: KOW motif-containing protein [Pyrinomonadaceae bacterium]|nr:KOW motif-containing protein [Pyrinomonadaceae bacterium]